MPAATRYPLGAVLVKAAACGVRALICMLSRASVIGSGPMPYAPAYPMGLSTLCGLVCSIAVLIGSRCARGSGFRDAIRVRSGVQMGIGGRARTTGRARASGRTVATTLRPASMPVRFLLKQVILGSGFLGRQNAMLAVELGQRHLNVGRQNFIEGRAQHRIGTTVAA